MIMKMCWNLEPTERPTFSKISGMINRLLGGQDEQEKVSWPEILSEMKANISGFSNTRMFPEKAPSSFQQLIYRNVQPEQVAEGEVCDEPKRYDRPCEQSCDHEEEEEPLMKTNNYQFC